MQFASVNYILFLALGVVVYYALPGARSRTWWLLGASIAFYYTLSAAWTAVLVAVVVVGFVGGLAISHARDARAAHRRLVISVVLAAGVLAVFKYAGFASSVVRDLVSATGGSPGFSLLRLALPVGVSFWTFQTIAYLVDVRRGRIPAEKDFARYALFVSFFAHVTAGPIARGSQLLPQLARRYRFSYENMRSALVLMGWGFFKKLVVADPLGVVANTVYADPQAWPGATHGTVLLVATLAFAVQIYCDFSGYTDIARGSARLFGVELARNFDRPYFSRSVKEFWRRWHMSLMAWLKDYIYIPLGGSRVSAARKHANVMAVFLVSGLWHGAGYTFLLWGAINGVYQILGDLTAGLRRRIAGAMRINTDTPLWRLVQVLTTFCLITVGWVFFRAESVSDALYILPRMLIPTPAVFSDGTFLHLGLSKPQTIVAAAGALCVVAMDFFSMKLNLPRILYTRPVTVRWTAYVLLVVAVVVFGHYGPVYNASDFAYFKF